MKKVSKKIWILSVFTVFVAVAMSFVSWLIYAVFAESYRDIKQQYYSVVTRQVVEDIQSSVHNGKQIERFYGIETVLNNMLELVSTDYIKINIAITDEEGKILYSTFSAEDNAMKADYTEMVYSDKVQASILFNNDSPNYRIVTSGDYEVMIEPIMESESKQIGALALFYLSDDIETELIPQKQSSDMATLICIVITIIILLIYFLIMPQAITKDITEEDGDVSVFAHKQKQNRLMFVVPVIFIMAGLMTQCVLSYNEYQTRYKKVMFEGATGISEYLGDIIYDLNEKGVPYGKMNGLGEYLVDKVEGSPLLWNVSVVDVYANTSELMNRDSEYNVSLSINNMGDENSNMHINVEISKGYIDEKMRDMLLVFIVAFAVALIMIYEFLKMPDSLFTRMSSGYKTLRNVQAGLVAPTIRLAAFIAYTGLYIGIPFSSVLIAQWNRSLYGLSVTFLASIPMTAELLATMLCSLLLLPIYKKMNLKLVLALSTLLSLAVNVMCFFANSPEQLILLRFMSGIGFAGIKYSLNTIVSNGSLTSENTTDNLAALNAGLLGGITCGASLGAVIAGAVSVQTSYLIAAIFMGVFLIVTIFLAPWKLLYENGKAEKDRQAQINGGGKRGVGILSLILNAGFIRYMLLVALPMNLGLMFVVAFFPGFVSSLGLPDVTTSYGYLINGLVGIYIGPQLLKALSKKLGKTVCVIGTLLLAALSVIILNIDAPLVIVLISVALLGLFDGFGTPATSDYFVNMDIVKNIGLTQGLAVLSVFGSVVQTISPVLYSIILASGLLGTNILGFVFAGAAVLFLITIKLGKTNKETAENNT